MSKNYMENIVKDGYKDIYYSFKLDDETEYCKLIKEISELKCSVIYCYIDNNNKLNELYNSKFYEYIESENIKNKISLKKSLQESLKEFNATSEISATLVETMDISNLDTSIETNTTHNIPYITINNESKGKISIEVASNTNLDYFLNKSTENLKTLLLENNTYINFTNGSFNYNFLFQPLKIVVAGKELFINLHATLYPTGNFILHYSIPLRDICFSNLYHRDKDIDYTCFIPEYIKCSSDKFDYVQSESINEAITTYNKYILNNLKSKLKNYSKYTVYILNDYSNMPNDFKNASPTLCRDIYWLAHAPYGYVNEQEKEKYLSFYSNRYSINMFSSLFVGSNGVSIIAFNKQKHSIPQIEEKMEDNEFKYLSMLIYINFSIEMILLKQSFYTEVMNFQINKKTSFKELTINQKKILEINTKIFSLTLYSYGSIKSLLDHIESCSYDFLPSSSIESIIKNNSETIQIKEAESREKRNSLNSLLTILIALFFGLDTIDSITKLIDNYVIKHSETYITHFNKYSLEIWLFFTILIFILMHINLFIDLYTNKIKKLFKNLKVQTWINIKKIKTKIYSSFN